MRSAGRMWARGVAGVLLTAGVGGGLLRAQDRVQLATRMEKAEAESSLDEPTLRPWHLKVSFQMQPAVKAGRAEEGTIEEWWAGPNQSRVVYTSPTFSATEVRNKDGFYRTSGARMTPYVLERVRREFVHPLPSRAVVEYSELEEISRKAADLQMECTAMMPPKKEAPGAPVRFPTYCFLKGTTQLVVSYEHGIVSIPRLRDGKFQSRRVPLEVAIGLGGATALRAKVEGLQAMAMPEGEFEPGERMVKESSPPVEVDESAAGATGSAGPNGAVISQPAPQYPVAAKQKHESGMVLVQALIGKDGHVKELAPVYSPGSDLERATVDAVRRWTYQPYVVSGEPVEVKTVIAVNFAIR